MNAAFYAPRPRSNASDVVKDKGRRARHFHRWVATVFAFTVAANFVAMPWGRPPAWITYAPLPPLFFLLATGLVMLVSPWITAARRAGRGEDE